MKRRQPVLWGVAPVAPAQVRRLVRTLPADVPPVRNPFLTDAEVALVRARQTRYAYLRERSPSHDPDPSDRP